MSEKVKPLSDWKRETLKNQALNLNRLENRSSGTGVVVYDDAFYYAKSMIVQMCMGMNLPIPSDQEIMAIVQEARRNTGLL